MLPPSRWLRTHKAAVSRRTPTAIGTHRRLWAASRRLEDRRRFGLRRLTLELFYHAARRAGQFRDQSLRSAKAAQRSGWPREGRGSGLRSWAGTRFRSATSIATTRAAASLRAGSTHGAGSVARHARACWTRGAGSGRSASGRFTGMQSVGSRSTRPPARLWWSRPLQTPLTRCFHGCRGALLLMCASALCGKLAA
jgi:hypothetical protein